MTHVYKIRKHNCKIIHVSIGYLKHFNRFEIIRNISTYKSSSKISIRIVTFFFKFYFLTKMA